MAKGAKIDALNGDGCTPLFVAAKQGHVSAIEALVSKGAKLELAEKKYEYTPLLIAVQRDHANAIEVLLAKGANVNALSKLGFPPIFVVSHLRNMGSSMSLSAWCLKEQTLM